jgi:DNA-binding NarL/FixJ family response regulator
MPLETSAQDPDEGRTGDRPVQMQGFTVLLVDARPLTRETFGRALEAASRDIRVIRLSHVSTLAHAVSAATPCLILLNVSGMKLSSKEVTAAVAEARSQAPAVPVVALSDSAHASEILDAIAGGLNGYVPMSLEIRTAVDALRFVAAGGTYAPAEPLLASLETTNDADTRSELPRADATEAPGGEARSVVMRPEALTPREQAVLDRLGQGESNKQIARELDMCEATVKVHVRHIMRKLGATNRTQAALLAERFKDQQRQSQQ